MSSRLFTALSSESASLLSATQKRFRHGASGPALRSGTSGIKATVFGAYGFVGRYVTGLLAGDGTQCVVPFRGDDLEWRHLKVMGDYGVVVPAPYSPADEDSIRRCIKGSDVVINLAGKDWETTHIAPWMINYSFDRVHVDLASTIARISVEEGVQNLVHVSALAADPYSISRWAQSKARGEEAVREIAPGATIVRPADVFGAEDRFLNMFARLFELIGRIPLVEGGHARVQPLFVEDLARGIHAIATSSDPSVMLGQEYDFAGPEDYTHREIVEYIYETIRAIEPNVINVAPSIAEAMGHAFNVMPSPLVSADRFQRMQSDNVLDPASAAKRLHDVGVEATSLEMPGFNFLHRYRSGSHFLDVLEGKTG